MLGSGEISPWGGLVGGGEEACWEMGFATGLLGMRL